MQYYSQSLDGDVSWNLVPSYEVKPIFESPLGIKAIHENLTYANPNRFFCHWIYREYFISTPLFLQKFVEPVESVYMASALAKLAIHILLAVLLAWISTGPKSFFKFDFMLVLFIINPLFQTNGYGKYMGIIDNCITYDFFYAFPLALLIIYLLPFIWRYYYGYHFKRERWLNFIWIPFALVISLSGPLNPGIMLIFTLLVFIFNVNAQKRMIIKGKIRIGVLINNLPKGFWFYLIPVSIFSLYSLYLGTYNSNTIKSQIPLSETYKRIPEGIYYIFTQKPGFLILFSLITVNVFIIYRHFRNEEGIKILKIMRWIGVFALIYILLLPMGGYREYRYNIIRYDTFMPVTICLMFIVGKTTLFLFQNLKTKKIWSYSLLVLTVAVLFTNADSQNSTAMSVKKTL